MLDDIIACGIDGIEAFSSYHDESVSRYFYDLARKNDLIVTCGSDYHGKTKPSVGLGRMNCSVDENDISLIVNQKSKIENETIRNRIGLRHGFLPRCDR